MVSAALFVMGAMTLLMAALRAREMPDANILDFEVAALWFVGGGAFVGLSRIWGELAERADLHRDKS
jgi:hypothetical protein